MQIFPNAEASVNAVITPLAEPASYWDQIFHIWLWVAIGIYLIVIVPMSYFLYRYRYRPVTNELGVSEKGGGHGLEILWTVIPLIIVVYLAMQSAAFYTQQRNAPAHSLEIRAEGMMWAWNFEYANGKRSTSNLYVPVGRPIKLLLTSRDVIHAFHLPDAKTMEDVVPGRVTQMWFQFNEIGDYRAFCREYCGTAHAYMLATVKVVSQEEFDEWLGGSG